MGNTQLFDQLINSGGCYLINVAPIMRSNKDFEPQAQSFGENALRTALTEKALQRSSMTLSAAVLRVILREPFAFVNNHPARSWSSDFARRHVRL